MSRITPRALAGLALVGALTLSSCSVIDQLVGENEDGQAAQEELVPEPTEDTTTPENGEDLDALDAGEEDVVPDCIDMYSAGLQSVFADQGRELIDDPSGSGSAWGSIDTNLVRILQDVRQDLRVSCTWYLPASESSSTTTISIVASELAPDIEDILRGEASSEEALGDGVLWKLDQTSSNISGEFDANEAHFLIPTTCPTSLAETDCTLWVSSTFSFGSSERLTRDAAEVLGKL